MPNLRWFAALAVVPALAFGEGTKQDRTAQQQSDQMQQQAAQQPGDKRLPKDTRAVKQFRAEDGFFTSTNYDVEGRISKVSKDKITIQRDELPAVELSIASNTKLQVDGEAASAAQLREGQEVKASFNLRGETPVAISLEAEKRERQAGERSGPGSTGLGAERPSQTGPEAGADQGTSGEKRESGGYGK